jgi:hypothetical protein
MNKGHAQFYTCAFILPVNSYRVHLKCQGNGFDFSSYSFVCLRQDGLELVILLPQSLKTWDYRNVPPSLVFTEFTC